MSGHQDGSDDAHADDDRVRRTIVIGARMLALDGCSSDVGGQVSVRASGDRGFWCTAFEYFDATRPERVALLDWDCNAVADDSDSGAVRLALALRMHTAIYHRRPDVNAIVHLHSHHVTALSALARPMGMFGVAAVLFLDDQVLYADDGVKPHISVATELADARVVWMKNHGALIASQSLEQAIVEAITLESCARLDLTCCAAGGTEIARAEAEAGRRAFRPHYLTNMWLTNLERVRQREPDLFA